jgi:ectoine hydroxylase-related dioxygenase (phytanoyl-CoA dioxygenase family)
MDTEKSQIDPFWAKEKADEVRKTSVTILKNVLPVEIIDEWNKRFQPLLQKAIETEKDDPNRGPNRYYVTLPFDQFWANPAIIDNDAIMAVVTELVGADGTLCQLATDTPVMGSEYQELHRDTRESLFPESTIDVPPYQLAVNFPLVDITPDSNNGPFEMAAGTHLRGKAEALARITSGELKVEPVYMLRGDAMIRDVRHIHRGTPNRSDAPRPMVVIGYSRRWLFRPEVKIRVPRPVLATLPPRCQEWLRYNPVFDSIEAAQVVEDYRAFAY